MAFLGLAQCDVAGNVNVSKFGVRVAGAGGFVNITQNAKKVVFCGTFTAGDLQVKVEDAQLKIVQEGPHVKFIEEAEHVTFSGDYARENKRKVVYVTERAVFRLEEQGLVLTEIAPGVDLQKDILDLMAFKPIISPELKLLDRRIFLEPPMGLTLV